MQREFTEAYKQLNAKQRQAVDTIDGPLLVVAGPGTGKTQLLSTRAANIVAKGEVAPGNILCLTYTETGASEMRQRLSRIMGPAGGEVAVHTFHSFGSWLIAHYPEQFSTERALAPLDDLSRYTVLQSLLAKLPFRHQLAIRDENERFIRQHAVEEAIRAFKQAGLTPKMARRQLSENIKEYEALQPLLEDIFGSTLSAKRLPAIAEAVETYRAKAASGSYSATVLATLAEAVEGCQNAGKTAILGTWRTRHTAIRAGKRILKSAANAELLSDTINLYDKYQKQLARDGRFDYEDMILWAAEALEKESDMLLDVAEHFQYIMVDEYQDTNGAQNRLLDALLHANPLDSPNVMAVGDDDQAIMRFQGAEVSGMLHFVQQYNPEIIVLPDNYRSSQQILDASRQVITQTDERLEVNLPDLQLSKQLTAQNQPHNTHIEHLQYSSPSAQYFAVAEYVAKLIKDGVPPEEIGIIGRKHAELSAFVPFLYEQGVAVSYERRENVLEHPAIMQLLQFAELIHALVNQPALAHTLLPTVLSADYWQLSAIELYNIAAQAKAEGAHWLDSMLASENQKWHDIAEWLLAAATMSRTHNFSQMFDVLLGRNVRATENLARSPYARIYDGQPPEIYVTILSHLICLRQAVLENRPNALGLGDFLKVCEQYRLSGIRLLDDNPVLRGEESDVQVMSAHGAKGREFQHVIILSAIDEVWGNRARSNNQRIFLPENMPLYPAGDAESDKLRLLYVAITRAKQNVLFTSYAQTDAGRATTPLSFIRLGENDQGWWQPKAVSTTTENAAELLGTAWNPTAIPQHELRGMLAPALRNYRLSPTALRDFIDFRYNGPRAAIEKHVLSFPSAYNAHSALGNATHKALQQAHAAFAAGKPLSDQELLERFDEALNASGLSETELAPAREHGHNFLPAFVAQFAPSDFPFFIATEQFLLAESPQLHVPMSGAIDALATTGNNDLQVVDYKTGAPPLPGWQTAGLSDSKKVSLHFYRQQLLFYKLLVDNSPQYRGTHHVDTAQLVFVESNENSDWPYVRLNITDFDPAELARTEHLIAAVHKRIMHADLPDTSQYTPDLAGIRQFEDYLLDT